MDGQDLKLHPSIAGEEDHADDYDVTLAVPATTAGPKFSIQYRLLSSWAAIASDATVPAVGRNFDRQLDISLNSSSVTIRGSLGYLIGSWQAACSNEPGSEYRRVVADGCLPIDGVSIRCDFLRACASAGLAE
uniref:Uncharacterized protein n=1 Tax=Anopheles atroparvus TaxID=41427 RepID=A0A182JFA7_ANOAO